MSIDDLDCYALISRLAGPLTPPARVAFRRAAEEALARVPCWGEGAVYRAVAALQWQFLNPPSFGRAGWSIEREPRPSRLKSQGPPLDSAGRAVALPQTRALSSVVLGGSRPLLGDALIDRGQAARADVRMMKRGSIA